MLILLTVLGYLVGVFLAYGLFYSMSVKEPDQISYDKSYDIFRSIMFFSKDYNNL